MPRYDYECQSCHHSFVVKQSFESEPVATCPDCQNVARRVIHSVPVVFKGSGFYVNDYGRGRDTGSSKSDSKEPRTEKGSKDKGDSESTSKAESKKEPTATKAP